MALFSQSLALSWKAVNSGLSTGTVSANTIRNTLTHIVSSEISSFVPACSRTFLRQSITMPTGQSMTLINRVRKM